MTSQQELVQQKETLMNDILKRLTNWDQSTDEATRIFSENNETIELMKTVDAQLTKADQIRYNKTHDEAWKKIIQMQEVLTGVIRAEKDKIEEQLVQMGKKGKIVSNYIDIQKESGLIRRNY